MNEVETRTIEQTVRIEAAPEVVWRYWVEPERLAEWFGVRHDVVPEPGGRCRIEMGHGRPVMSGEYVELQPYERLVFTFGWEGNEPGTALAPGSTRVEVTFVPDGDATILTLRHSDMPATHAADHAKGWAEHLPKLAAAAV